MEASVWATNMCRSVWTALFFSSIFQIKAIKRPNGFHPVCCIGNGLTKISSISANELLPMLGFIFI
jgi:hypothetical protein